MGRLTLDDHVRLIDLRDLRPEIYKTVIPELGNRTPIVTGLSPHQVGPKGEGIPDLTASDAKEVTLDNDQTLDLAERYKNEIEDKAGEATDDFANQILARDEDQVITDQVELDNKKRLFQNDVATALKNTKINVIGDNLAGDQYARTDIKNPAITDKYAAQISQAAENGRKVIEGQDFLVSLDKKDPVTNPQIFLRSGLTSTQAQQALVAAHEAIIEAVAEHHGLILDPNGLSEFLNNIASELVDAYFAKIEIANGVEQNTDDGKEERTLLEVARNSLLLRRKP